MLLERLRLLSSSPMRGELLRAAREKKKEFEQSKEKEEKQVVLTKGCMLANDGSDDSVDADPFARSKNEMASQIR